MMNCDEAKEMLNDFIDNTLEPGQKKKLKELLASDPSCKELFEQARFIKDQVKNLPNVTPSAEFDTKLREKILGLNRGEEKQGLLTRKGLSIAFSGAFMIIMLYVFTAVDFGAQNQDSLEGQPASKINDTLPTEAIVDNENVSGNEVDNAIKQDSLKNEPQEVDNSKIKLTGDQ